MLGERQFDTGAGMSWREQWSWWREFQSLGRREVSRRDWHDERELRAARLYVGVTNPTIVVALIGAAIAICVAVLTIGDSCSSRPVFFKNHILPDLGLHPCPPRTFRL